MLKKYVCIKSLCILLNTNVEKYITLNIKPNDVVEFDVEDLSYVIMDTAIYTIRHPITQVDFHDMITDGVLSEVIEDNIIVEEKSDQKITPEDAIKAFNTLVEYCSQTGADNCDGCPFYNTYGDGCCYFQSPAVKIYEKFLFFRRFPSCWIDEKQNAKLKEVANKLNQRKNGI